MLINVMKYFGIIILIISIIIGILRLLKSNNLLESRNTDIKEENDIKNQNTNSNINTNINTNSNNNNNYYDLIIVGAGLSGLTATYESNKLTNNSLKILLLETSSNFGGNAKNEKDGINVLMPDNDNFTAFFDESFEFGRYTSERDLLSIMISDSYYLYDFLYKELKCDSLKIIQSEGSKVPRTLIYDNVYITTGQYLTNKLYENISNISTTDIHFNSHFIDIIINEDYTEVKGVIYEIQEGDEIKNISAYSKAIILATGGYGSDFYAEESLLKEFIIQLYYFPTFSTVYTQGIGIKMARNKGGLLLDQRQAEIYPTCFVDLLDRFNRHKILAPDLFRELGGILINKRGKRFCNEMGNRRYVAQNILKNCDIVTDPSIIKQYEGFLIINEEIKEKFGEKFEDYLSKGYFRKYKSFDEFSKVMNISEYYVNIRTSILNYNQGYESKRDKYGRSIFPTKFKMGDTIYVAIITPCIFHTFGGVRINEKAEIVNESKKGIKGLYAAGQIIGGVHGVMAMQGSVLTQSTVFGKLAAKSAVDYINNINN